MKRYGKVVHQVEAAWEILYHTVYNCTDGIADNNTDFIVKFPDWDPSLDSGSNISKQNQMHALHTLQKLRRFFFKENSDVPLAHLWYSTQELIKDLKPFLDAGNDLAGSITIWRAILNDMRLMFHDRYDLVDITRQVLSKLANLVYGDAVIAFRRKDATALNLHSQKFLQLIKDIDLLLASDDNFLLGTWL